MLDPFSVPRPCPANAICATRRMIVGQRQDKGSLARALTARGNSLRPLPHEREHKEMEFVALLPNVPFWAQLTEAAILL